MDAQECKIFFDIETTKEEAQYLISKYCNSTIDTFQSKRDIGANVVTFAIATVPVKAAAKMAEDGLIKRVDVISTTRGGKPTTGCEGGCGCGSGG
jgi:hypothetical protein